MEKNEWGFTSHLCKYRLNWVRRTSWGLWYEWGDTVLQTQDSKLSSAGLRPSTSILGHRGCPQYSIFTIEQEGNLLFFKTWMPEQETNPFWYCCYIHVYTNTWPDYYIKMMCYVFLLVSISWLAKQFQLLIFMTLVMYYIGLNIYFFFFSFYMCRLNSLM